MPTKIKTNYLPELKALLLGRSKPGMVTVNLTDRCNQRCIYCEIGQGTVLPGQDRLTYDHLMWIIDRMADEKIRRISLCGGEPFLFEGIIELVAYAGKKDIQCTITSNGMTIHKLTDADLAVLKTYKTLINISVDSFKGEVQNFTRGTNQALHNAELSIEKLIEKGIPLTVLCVITKHNYSMLYELVQETYHRKIRQILFQPVIQWTNYPGIPALEDKPGLNVPADKLNILENELKRILHFEQRHRISTNVYRILPWIGSYIRAASAPNSSWFWKDVLGKFYCRDIYAIIDITYDGGIQPCGLAKAGVNIKHNGQEGLVDMWKRSTASLRHDLENGEFHPFCNACCHHFSRNMLASIMRYPLHNRKALFIMIGALFARILRRTVIKMKN